VEVTCIAWYASPDGGYHTVSFNRDVTDMVRAQQALRESEERYRVVSEMSRDLITEATADGQPTYVSPGVEDAVGYTAEELLEMPPYETVHPDDLERVRTLFEKAVSSEEPVRIEGYRLRTRDGSWRWFETTGHVYRRADGEVRFLAVNRDITARRREEEERRELQEQMQRSQKLEGLGVMAGGIAHDFNNLLTPILGEASLWLRDLPADAPDRARVEKIAKAARRAAALTNQMLSYAGKRPLLIEQLDVSNLVQEMGQLLGSVDSGRAVLDYELVRDLPPVDADAAQLSQVVVNLISNASEALPDGKGRITVRTGVVDVAGPSASMVFADRMVEGLHVYFEVADTGCGMDAETTRRIFDPFFTTKFAGRGLGLAAVTGIIRAHRGAIEIESEPGVGTRFRVLLPASTRRAEPPTESSVPPGWRASGTVLVIDDDDGVRDLAADVLGRAGLCVLSAANGLEGIELFRRHADEIRLVLLDLTMPGTSGSETFESIRRIRRDARVVMVSGYSEARATAALVGREPEGFLKKPFLPEALLECVRKSLDRGTAGG
jgi:PAS domain S-box-containing protein